MHAPLALIFFLSGASALIFEALWFRLAGLSLGNSTWSASLVLAAFMGGLALGNGLVARWHDRVKRPIRFYAGLEFAIGFGGVAIVLLLPHLAGIFGPLLGGIADLPLLLNGLRLTIAFVILLLPAIAMGATLPVLAKALTQRDPNFGANIGWLYGWNTAGATLAVIGTELVLVPLFGILSSGLVALTCNLAAALIALRLADRHEPSPVAEPAAEAATASPRTRRFLAVAFFSGFLMLALEVVWFRFLLLTRDDTSLIFSVMLAIVLAGIAIGGLVASQWFRSDERAYRWLRHVTSASAALVVLTYWGYDLFAVHEATMDTATLTFVGFALFLMFPVAVLSGIAFTMVNRAVKEDLGGSARTAGIATLYNTVGAMLGSLGAGFVLLPAAGMELSFFVAAAGYLLVAFVVPVDAAERRRVVFADRGAVAVALLCLVLFPFGLMQKRFFSERIAWLPTHELVGAREGLVETIRYYKRDVFGEPKFYRLLTNGHSMSATTVAAKRYMKLYVYLPLALQPDMRDVLLVSYGVGATAKALTDSPGLQRIDIVDISKDILEMSSIIYPGDDNPLRDRRVAVHVEDGRFFLNTTGNRYDLITSEPPPPKIAGVVNLYSQEYFELIRARLNTGGYASYWLPVQQLTPLDMMAIVRAFCNAFDDCSLWSAAGLEWMLLGSNGATSPVDSAQFAAQWQVPHVRQELVALGLETPAQLGSLFMGDAEFLNGLTEFVKPVVDNHPARISSASVRNEYVDLYDFMLDEGLRVGRFEESALIRRLWPADLRAEATSFFGYERLIRHYFTGGTYRRGNDPYRWEAIDHLLNESSLTTLPLWLLGSDHDTQAIVSRLLERDGYRDEFALELARRYTAERDFELALSYANAHVTARAEVSLPASNLYLYLLARNGMIDRAWSKIDELSGLEEPEVDRFVTWYVGRFSPGASTAAHGGMPGTERAAGLGASGAPAAQP